MAVWTVAFGVIALVDDTIATYACVFLATVALGFVIPLMYTLTNESFPTRARSTGVSLTDGLGHLGGAAGPILATTAYAIAGTSGFATVFLLVAATGLLAAILMLFSVDATGRTLGGSKAAAPVPAE
jgi:putative MFS transporter